MIFKLSKFVNLFVQTCSQFESVLNQSDKKPSINLVLTSQLLSPIGTSSPFLTEMVELLRLLLSRILTRLSFVRVYENSRASDWTILLSASRKKTPIILTTVLFYLAKTHIFDLRLWTCVSCLTFILVLRSPVRISPQHWLEMIRAI